MKKRMVILVAVMVLGVVIVEVSKDEGESERAELEVVSYFRALQIPRWAPLSLGYQSGTDRNPAYINLQQMRHLVIIVSVPARRLLEVAAWAQIEPNEANEEWVGDVEEEQEQYFPEFTLIENDGSLRRARRVVAWPRKGNCVHPTHFEKPEEWYPQPGEDPEKRYRVAISWWIGQKHTIWPFELQMGDDEPIVAPKDKHDFYHQWQ